MWLVVHLWAGMAIASLLGRPLWLAVVLVVGAHVVLDLVPHWDYPYTAGVRLWGALDVLACAASLVVAVMGEAGPRVLLLGALSALPDLDIFIWDLGGRRGAKLFPSHWPGFPHGQAGPLRGLLTQLTVVVVAAAIVLR